MADAKSGLLGQMFGADGTDTFLGLPACESIDDLQSAIALLGVPMATPYPSVGPYCAAGPDAIRQGIADYAGRTHHMDFDLDGPLLPDDGVAACDLGNLELDAADPASNREHIRQTVRAIIDRDAVPIVIGGDDSVPIPMIEAFAGTGWYTIVQIDAHIDWREEVDGERWGLSSTMRRASEMEHVERIVQIGQRAIGSARPGDHEDAVAWGAEFVSASRIHAEGIQHAIDLIPAGSNVIFAFDCDALDPAIMPGVIGRAPGGLTYWQVVELMRGIAARSKIAAFDLVEFMPERDIDQIGALTAARILVNAIGLIARQVEPSA